MADHRRFFVSSDQITDTTAAIRGDVARQIYRVLRLRPGDAICLLDGSGLEYDAEIVSLSKDEVTATIKDSRQCDLEPRVRLTLAVCLPKSDRMELIVQKGTELGISECIVVDSERVVSRPSASALEGRLTRWRRIAAESAEQSGRAVAPEVSGPVSVGDLARLVAGHDLALVAWEEERRTSLGHVLRESRPARSALVVIGPEGGLAGGEVENLTTAGAKSVSLGKRLLRVDTAAIAACAIVMHELESEACGAGPAGP